MLDTVRIIENAWISMPDGRRLAARLWLPEAPGPHPAILEYLPYRKRDATAGRDETTHGTFSQRGYACVRVDIAGTGDSEGRFDDEYSEQELSDGEAIIDWIAAQDWCDGSVGIIGISWGGFNGLQLAYRQPPALKAVVSVASTADRYADDIHYMGGCLLSDNIAWSGTMTAYLSRPADPLLRPDWREDWIARMEEMPHLGAEWLKHQTRDDFWKHGSVCEDFSRINVPVLAITGWADSYVNTPGWLVENMDAPAKALIGPWEHRYAHISKLGAADFHSEVLGWFDRWLKGEQNGAENLPAFRTFCREFSTPTPRMSAPNGRWIAEADWPSPNITNRVLCLSGDRLTVEPGSASRSIGNTLTVGQAGGNFCPGMRFDDELPGDQATDDAASLCYDFPLDGDLELLGRPSLTLAFSVDRPVAQVVARLCEVTPDGTSQRITYRPFNLTHVTGHDRPEPLVPGQRYEVTFELNACAHRLAAGHSLRLALSTSYWPIVWPSPEVATLTVHEDASRLTLPVRSVQDEIDPANPPSVAPHRPETIEVVSPPSGSARQDTQPDGRLVLDCFDDFGTTTDLLHGMTTSSEVATLYEIDPNDPASARFESRWRFSYSRGDWQVEIRTENRMTCDGENFHLHRNLRATEGAEKSEVLAREWSETIPRGLL